MARVFITGSTDGWAVRQHASVIDLPIDPVTTAGAPGSGGSAAERAAVNYALAKHVVLVAPAGDRGTATDAVNRETLAGIA